MWGEDPASAAVIACDYFNQAKVKNVLIPGIGYGRNAVPFFEAGMQVTGIEISETAINIAKNQLGITGTIYHGSVTDMPFNNEQYDGIFCYALIHLLSEEERKNSLTTAISNLFLVE